MRAPLNSIYITNPFGQPGYGVFGKHAGVDLRAAIGTPVYAPAAGRVITADLEGNIILEAEIEGMWHRFLHLSQIVVKSGRFNEGQLIAYSGNSGNVAAHLHWDVRRPNTAWNRSFSDYIDPMSLLNKEGGTMIADRNYLDVVYRKVLERQRGASEGEDVYLGKDAGWVFLDVSNSRESAIVAERTASYEQAIRDLQVALVNEKSKPPVEVIKEVEKIIEKPVEVIKEVPVYTHDQETKDNVTAILRWVKSIWGLVMNLYKR